ncbi:MAG: hypothetical protein GX877_00850 [Bacteroidales bacterium]|nr:hypothetical protein [Bacteroidales bacterium]
MRQAKSIICSGEELFEYLPHRPPALLIDTYHGKDQKASYTGYTPKKESLFCENGFFREEGLLEHMAQSVAMARGVREANTTETQEEEQTEGVIPGFVASFKNVNLYRRAKEEEPLYTEVEETFKNPVFSVVQVSTYNKDGLLAEAEMKVVKTAGLGI